MITIIPALDIIEGKCVRLEKGDYGKQTRYSTDPLDWARRYEDAGFRRLHLVDLDGARTGKVQNLKVLESIAAATSLAVDFGGGVQSSESLKNVWDAGARMVTVGSIAVKNESLLNEWITSFGTSRFILGADVKENKIMISGWMDTSGTGLFDFIEHWMEKGITQVLCTDIEKDGMLSGASVDLYRSVMNRFPGISLIASGGVAGAEEIAALNELGLHGVVLGKALLEGQISFGELKPFLEK